MIKVILDERKGTATYLNEDNETVKTQVRKTIDSDCVIKSIEHFFPGERRFVILDLSKHGIELCQQFTFYLSGKEITKRLGEIHSYLEKMVEDKNARGALEWFELSAKDDSIECTLRTWGQFFVNLTTIDDYIYCDFAQEKIWSWLVLCIKTENFVSYPSEILESGCDYMIDENGIKAMSKEEIVAERKRLEKEGIAFTHISEEESMEKEIPYFIEIKRVGDVFYSEIPGKDVFFTAGYPKDYMKIAKPKKKKKK